MYNFVSDLGTLSRHCAVPCVSLYFPVTAPAQGEGRDTRARLQRLLQRVEARLDSLRLRTQELCDGLRAAALRALTAAPAPSGLAMFFSPHIQRVVPLEIPIAEALSVEHHFNLRPLLGQLEHAPTFLVLVLDPDDVALYSGTPQHLRRMQPPPTLPQSIEALFPEAPEESGVWPQRVDMASALSSLSPASARAGNRIPADTVGDTRLQRRFVRLVDSSLRVWLRAPDAALLLCASPRMAEVYREVSPHRDALVDLLPLPQAGRDELGMLMHVRGAMLGYIRRHRARKLAYLPALRRSGQLQAGLSRVLPAADEGRVDTLFVNRHAYCWGQYDPRRKRISRQPARTCHNEDLIELAALRTSAEGGNVLLVDGEDLPREESVAALLRF